MRLPEATYLRKAPQMTSENKNCMPDAELISSIVVSNNGVKFECHVITNILNYIFHTFIH